MFNYSSNFKERIIKADRVMSRSNVTTKLAPKKTSQPKSNLSSITAKREQTKATSKIPSKQEVALEPKNELLDKFMKNVEGLTKPGVVK